MLTLLLHRMLLLRGTSLGHFDEPLDSKDPLANFGKMCGHQGDMEFKGGIILTLGKELGHSGELSVDMRREGRRSGAG